MSARQKLTPWFPATVKPVRNGYYDYTGWGLGDRPSRRLWTGTGWQWDWELYVSPGLPDDEWRGLATPPKDAP
jgi:hypothetical protein